MPNIDGNVVERPVATWRDYYELTKPRVVMLIVLTAVVGMFLAIPTVPPLSTVALATIGIALASCSAAAINQILDARIDARMARTRHRPLITGSITEAQAIAFAAGLCLLSMTILWAGVNAITAVLTFASFIGYAFVYTLFLKRNTPQNIVVGGSAGAAPPMLGWTAVTGELHANALLLFLIVFIWTPPHFWALAIARKEEYANVGIPMLPVTHGVPYTKLCILLYTGLLLLVSVLPWFTGLSGVPYLIAALVLGGVFFYKAFRLERSENTDLAMPVFSYSITYLIALFGALLVDHYL